MSKLSLLSRSLPALVEPGGTMRLVWGSVIGVLVGVVVSGSVRAAELPQDQGPKFDAEVNALVMGYSVDGVPYGAARRLGPAAVPRLAGVLRQVNMKPYWRNTVQILNYVGEANVFPILREFIVDRFQGEIDQETYLAISAAIVTMGPLARISQPAFQFLADGSSPNSWDIAKWTFRDKKAAKRNLQLSRNCINALGSSGTEQADQVLTKLAEAGAQNPHWDSLRDIVKGALVGNREIMKEGFENHRKRRDEFYTDGGGKKRN